MAFRIKSKYVFKANILENEHWSNQIPELTFAECDDVFLTNRMNNTNGTILIQPDRIKFCNIFNITEQDISYAWFVGNEEQTKTFSIKKGCYTSKALEEILNSFDKRINFTFTSNGKNMTEPQSQSQCHVNQAMDSDMDNPNMPNICSGAPPPYESIRRI